MTDQQDGIDADIQGPIAVFTLRNSRRRNAFTPEMRRALTDHLVTANKTVEIRAVILTGAGDHFCVGADVSRGGAERTAVQVRENTKEVNRLLEAIITAPKPYLCAVRGDAFGGGMSMAMACDFVFAGQTARFGTAFAKIGLLPDLGMLHTLPLRVGQVAAKRLMMTCEHVHAGQAHRMNIVDELVDGDPLDAARTFATQLAACAPLPLGYIKAAYADGMPTWRSAMRMELDVGSFLAGTADCREGVSALMEKRPPVFGGR